MSCARPSSPQRTTFASTLTERHGAPGARLSASSSSALQRGRAPAAACAMRKALSAPSLRSHAATSATQASRLTAMPSAFASRRRRAARSESCSSAAARSNSLAMNAALRTDWRASASARAFCSRGTCTYSTTAESRADVAWTTRACAARMRRGVASPEMQSMTTRASPHTARRAGANGAAMRRPSSSAAYSDVQLSERPRKRAEAHTGHPSASKSSAPAPDAARAPPEPDDPSTCKIQAPSPRAAIRSPRDSRTSERPATRKASCKCAAADHPSPPPTTSHKVHCAAISAAAPKQWLHLATTVFGRSEAGPSQMRSHAHRAPFLSQRARRRQRA